MPSQAESADCTVGKVAVNPDLGFGSFTSEQRHPGKRGAGTVDPMVATAKDTVRDGESVLLVSCPKLSRRVHAVVVGMPEMAARLLADNCFGAGRESSNLAYISLMISQVATSHANEQMSESHRIPTRKASARDMRSAANRHPRQCSPYPETCVRTARSVVR